MNILDIISLGIESNPALSVFLATFFLGDEMVYLFGFLSGHGILKLWIVIIFATLGNGLCDVFWFSVARFKIFSKIKSKMIAKPNGKKKKTSMLVKGEKHHRLFWLLIMSKFFYGTRLLMIFHTSDKEKSFKKLIFINSLAVVSWVTIISSSLWLVGRWTQISLESVSSVNRIVGLGVVTIMIIYLLKKFVLWRIFDFLLHIKKESLKAISHIYKNEKKH